MYHNAGVVRIISVSLFLASSAETAMPTVKPTPTRPVRRQPAAAAYMSGDYCRNPTARDLAKTMQSINCRRTDHKLFVLPNGFLRSGIKSAAESPWLYGADADCSCAVKPRTLRQLMSRDAMAINDSQSLHWRFSLALLVPHFSDCNKISLPNRSGPYWSNPPFFNF